MAEEESRPAAPKGGVFGKIWSFISEHAAISLGVVAGLGVIYYLWSSSSSSSSSGSNLPTTVSFPPTDTGGGASGGDTTSTPTTTTPTATNPVVSLANILAAQAQYLTISPTVSNSWSPSDAFNAWANDIKQTIPGAQNLSNDALLNAFNTINQSVAFNPNSPFRDPNYAATWFTNYIANPVNTFSSKVYYYSGAQGLLYVFDSVTGLVTQVAPPATTLASVPSTTTPPVIPSVSGAISSLGTFAQPGTTIGSSVNPTDLSSITPTSVVANIPLLNPQTSLNGTSKTAIPT